MPAFLRWLLGNGGEGPYIKESLIPFAEATIEDVDTIIANGELDPDPDEPDDDDDDDEEP